MILAKAEMYIRSLRFNVVVETVHPQLGFQLLQKFLEQDGQGYDALAVRRDAMQPVPILQVHGTQRVIDVLGFLVDVAKWGHCIRHEKSQQQQVSHIKLGCQWQLSCESTMRPTVHGPPVERDET